MNPTTFRRLAAGRNDHLVFIIVVIAAYLSTFSAALQWSWPEIIGLSAAGMVYSVVGIYGYEFCERTHSLPARLVYLAIQIPLSAVIVYFSRGAGWIVTLPLVSNSVVLLQRRWAVVVGAILAAIYIALMGALYGWTFTVQISIQYVAATLFVAASTQIAVNEQAARAQVERLAAEVGEANRKLRQYAAQVEELAMAKERNRLAREIHDSLGHYLTAINMQIEAARAVMDTDRARVLDALDNAQSLTKEGLADVRRSVAALRALPMQDRLLTEALAALADECGAAGLRVEFAIAGAPRPLAPQAELTLYRAAQEGLTNVHKHARASHVALRLEYGDGVRLIVQDDGAGSSQADGFGLMGVRERVHLLGGKVNIHTAPEQGFRLEIELPK